MDNAMIIALGAALVIFIIFDHIKYWQQTSDFTSRASELSVIYNYFIKHFADEKDNTEVVVYEGLFYNVEVKKGDYQNFVYRIQEIVADVKKKYAEINPRYLEQADSETAEDIEWMHNKMEEIDYAIRIIIWQNGWKK